ncbi:invasion associated locus B family protein [uncultured Roseovarius sp.]|uniref:invasion associated locus B family protein n=1 Tax=uncultured Roseovarius sp. TaxID=293344 RepID=UPI00261CF4B8|nr:invasion associated locus B family protein [uncultured Roseovarius sp.]
MPRLLNALPLIAALTLGAALHAQETETAEPEAEAEAPAQAETETAPESAENETTQPESSEAEELDMGQEVVEDPTYIKETYGDWQLKCFRSEGQEDLCQMYQLLTEDAGNPVAEFSLFKLPENAQAAAGATIVVPLGTLLTKELLVSIDGGKAKSFAYSFCSMVGCFARIGLTTPDLDAFKRGAKANLQIVPAQAPDQKVNINVSLNGFTAAFENVSTVQN